jgi:RpiB/LacA/LacB family sugar-phosphate isomerase
VSAPGSHAPAPWPPRVVALGADHGGVGLKDEIARYLTVKHFTVVDCGTHGRDAVDYPDFAAAVARAVSDGRAGAGVVLDTMGIGSAIAANKIAGIRAALVRDVDAAVSSRAHNDANVLSLGAKTISAPQAFRIVSVWLGTPFEGDRHLRRVRKIHELER